MSTETSPADGEHRDETESEQSSPGFPTLTVTAEGVAERRQQVGTSMSCIETTPVQLSFTTTLGSESEWEVRNPRWLHSALSNPSQPLS